MVISGSASARIFISYRRADAGWPARWLADRLAGQFGAGVVFQDVDSIQPGDDFAAAIEAAVGACAVLLAVIGPQWLAAEGDAGRRLDDPQDWVRLEIEAALKREVRIIPVLVDGARMPAAVELPPSLRDLVRRQAVALSPASLDVRRLVSVLEIALEHEGWRGVQDSARASGPAQPDQSWTDRFLMSAVLAALTLTGQEETEALISIIDIAAQTAPERVEWLAREAKRAARSIVTDSVRSSALARVAGAVASADPERAEAIARSIEDASQRVWALTRLTSQLRENEH